MLDLNIKISHLSTVMLDIKDTESLEKFLPLLNRMNLKELIWDWNDHNWNDHVSKEKFRHLPLRYNPISLRSLRKSRLGISLSQVIKEKDIRFHSITTMTG